MGRSASQPQMAAARGCRPPPPQFLLAAWLPPADACPPRRPASRPACFLHTVVNAIFELMKAYLMRATTQPEALSAAGRHARHAAPGAAGRRGPARKRLWLGAAGGAAADAAHHKAERR